MPVTIDQILPYLGGGSSAIGLLFLSLFLSGKLPSPMERTLLKAENARIREDNKDKDDYIKKLVQELSEVADEVRTDVMPAMTNALMILDRISQDLRHSKNAD